MNCFCPYLSPDLYNSSTQGGGRRGGRVDTSPWLRGCFPSLLLCAALELGCLGTILNFSNCRCGFAQKWGKWAPGKQAGLPICRLDTPVASSWTMNNDPWSLGSLFFFLQWSVFEQIFVIKPRGKGHKNANDQLLEADGSKKKSMMNQGSAHVDLTPSASLEGLHLLAKFPI